MIKFAFIYIIFAISILSQERKQKDQVEVNPKKSKLHEKTANSEKIKEIDSSLNRPIQSEELAEESKEKVNEAKDEKIHSVQSEPLKEKGIKSATPPIEPTQIIEKQTQKVVKIEKKTEPVKEEKKYSAQFALGRGLGYLNIRNDRYDPTASLSEFVALSLLSASQSSSGYSSILSGNLGVNSLFALFLLNDELSSNRVRSNSNSSFNRFYIENREKDDFIGIRFGLSNGSYTIKSDVSRNEISFLPVAFFGNSNPIINIYMLQSYLKNSEPIYLGINTFDVALNFHLLPEEKFDPYISIGAGIGSCFANCNAFRFFARVGIRYNFEDYYTFLEQEMQTVLFSSKFNYYQPLQERITLLGFGFYL